MSANSCSGAPCAAPAAMAAGLPSAAGGLSVQLLSVAAPRWMSPLLPTVTVECLLLLSVADGDSCPTVNREVVGDGEPSAVDDGGPSAGDDGEPSRGLPVTVGRQLSVTVSRQLATTVSREVGGDGDGAP